MDHGKTQLIKALTGIDTDRLAEEQKRGITIEVGYAYVDLGFENPVGIVDVPGHERFIKNMLAGAGGVDVAMLIVAADEGFMPQTIEHLDILRMLNIHHGVVVITKTDLVDDEWVGMIREDVATRVEGCFLENAPVCEVSSRTGKGIEELKDTLRSIIEQAENKNLNKPFRLPVDRVFSSVGFGTIITGTLIEGSLHKDDKLTIYPSELEARVRNLQVHSRPADVAYAGQRVAVNIAGVKKEDISKGDVLAQPASMQNAQLIDVKITLIKNTSRRIKNNDMVHFYHGARAMLCRVRLLDVNEVRAGESCYAQLRLAESLASKAKDCFVVRFYSPAETIGGGVIINPNARMLRRKRAETMEYFAVQEKGSIEDILCEALGKLGESLQPVGDAYKALGLQKEEFQRLVQKLTEQERLINCGKDRYLTDDNLDFFSQKLIKMLEEFHKSYPLLGGMGREEVRQRLFSVLDAAAGEALVERLVQYEGIGEANGFVKCADFEPKYTERRKKLKEEILQTYKKAGIESPTLADLLAGYQPKEASDVKQLVQVLIAEKHLQVLGDGLYMDREFYDHAVESSRAQWASKAPMSLADFRDKWKTSRKYALALLEHLDAAKITKKEGDTRVWL